MRQVRRGRCLLEEQPPSPIEAVQQIGTVVVREDDEISVPNALGIAPGRSVEMVLHHSDGTEEPIQAKHSCNAEQIGWIRAGGALTLLRQ